ncbi:MAG: TonB-dependent receptor [Halieaceae bacterium]
MMLSRLAPITALLLAATLAVTLASSANAQNSPGGLALEEIVVTASKRETALQDTPLAVTAFSATLTEQLDINSPFDFEKLTPSLSYQQDPNKLSIRGVGRFTNALGVNPGVAIYNDGVFTAEATSLSTQPINIQRTEILRGPQGTLYGRNTTGGAVNIITRRPTSEFVGDFRVKYGNEAQEEYAGLISGPITDFLRYKLHFNIADRDGMQDNLAGEDLRDANSNFWEAQIEWDITDKLLLWAEYNSFDVDYIPGTSPSEDPYDCINAWSGLGQSTQYLACQAGQENPSIDDPFTVANNTQGRVKLANNNNWTARLSYQMAQAELSYLFGYIEYDWDSRTDYDGTGYEDYSVNLDIGQYQEQTTHELQLTSNWDNKRWNYILGLYYFEDKNEQPYNINAPDYDRIKTVTRNFVEYWDNPLGILYFQKGTLDNESWAVYGEIDYDINELWTLTLGARYSEDDYKGGETQLQYYDLLREGAPFAYDASQSSFAGDPSRYVDTIDARYNDSFNNVTGKATLSYRPSAGQLFWGTLSNGYKMGGVRLGALEKFYAEAAGVADNGEFDQEEVVSYELGWKGELLDNKLTTEVVGYYYDYSDMQQLRNFRTPPPANITLEQVVNLDTEMYGLEFSGTWLATDNLRAILTYSYNYSEITSDAYFEDFTFNDRDADGNLIAENVSGNELILTPTNKGALSLMYFYPSSIGEFTLGGTLSYIDDRYFDLGNNERDSNYSLLDLQASWTSESGRYKLLGVINNATDENAYNTYGCTANSDGVYGTPSFITRCSGNPIDQRLYSLQLMIRI